MDVYVLEVELEGWEVFGVFRDKEEAEKEGIRLVEETYQYSSYAITETNLI